MVRAINEQRAIRPSEAQHPSNRAHGVQRRAARVESASFEEVLSSLAQKTSGVRFSKHAQHRIAERGVHFGEKELHKLEDAVEIAAAKGSRDSLVLMDNLALVVSIRNRIVITAVDSASRRDSIFTNIDSVVLTE